MSDPSDLEKLAKSYLDMWQDQFTAMATDPANAAAMARLFGAMTQPTEGTDEPGSNQRSRPGGAAASSGAAPAGTASGDRDDRLSELADRVGQLEQRLERLERKLGRKDGGTGGKSKKRKS